jgi:hypothetical protein
MTLDLFLSESAAFRSLDPAGSGENRCSISFRASSGNSFGRDLPESVGSGCTQVAVGMIQKSDQDRNCGLGLRSDSTQGFHSKRARINRVRLAGGKDTEEIAHRWLCCSTITSEKAASRLPDHRVSVRQETIQVRDNETGVRLQDLHKRKPVTTVFYPRTPDLGKQGRYCCFGHGSFQFKGRRGDNLVGSPGFLPRFARLQSVR